MSFTERDFIKLKKVNGIKKGCFAIREYLENKKPFDYVKQIVGYINKYYNYNFIISKKIESCRKLYNILMQELKKLNPFIEDRPFDSKTQKKFNNVNIKILLDNIRSPFNVGSIIRTANAMGVREILFLGDTPDFNNNKVKRVSMGATLSHNRIENVIELFTEYKEKGYKIVALEKTNNSIEISTMDIDSPIILIVGNEEFGVDIDILRECDEIVHINMFGNKNSLNVSVATGIALYTLVAKINQ